MGNVGWKGASKGEADMLGDDKERGEECSDTKKNVI